MPAKQSNSRMFLDLRKKNTRFGIGLSCGLSGRGVDAALVRIKGAGPGLHVKLVSHRHFPYAVGLRTRLIIPRKDVREVSLLNFELGDYLAECSLEMVRAAQREMHEVDFVAVNGYTVAHNPPRGYDQTIGTLQVGEPAIVAERTQMPVVSQFRARDLAAGGQGGPISAYADHLLFSREDRTVVRLHLGGVTTLSLISPNFDQLISFDAGPGNIAIDGAIRILSNGNQEMDEKGVLATKGVVIDEFLEYLLDHPYFAKVPPKTTGRDEFGPEIYLRDALAGRKERSLEDLIATITSAVSYCVVRAFNRFIKPQHKVDRVIVSGGGSQNPALLQRIKNGIPDATLRLSDEYGLPYDAVDSVCVAILGNETLCGKPNNVPHATGAQEPIILGQITPF